MNFFPFFKFYVFIWPIPAPTLYSQGSCPPPVGQFITLNGQTYRDRAGALIKARKERQALVARLGVKDNQFYNSPKCSVLEDAGNDLYSNFGIREEYDPVTFSRSKECLLYLASTSFTQSRVPMTILLIAEVTPGLSSECNVYVSSRAAFTIQFCEAGDTDPACSELGARNVEFTGGPGVRTTRTNFTDIGDGVILQREIVVNSAGSDSGAGASSAEIEKSSSSNIWTDYVVPIVLAVLIALVLILIVVLGCCWWNGCLR